MLPVGAYDIDGGRKINTLLFHDVTPISMSPSQEAFI
jgi:hypothetical protein